MLNLTESSLCDEQNRDQDEREADGDLNRQQVSL
jgi:hypothetical protein